MDTNTRSPIEIDYVQSEALPILGEYERFTRSPEYKHLGGLFAKEREVLEQAYYRTDFERISRLEDLLPFKDLETALRDIKRKIVGERVRRWDEAKAGEGLARLRSFVGAGGHLALCPLCQKATTFSDDDLLNLLVYGQCDVSCGCPKKGWALNMLEETTPVPLREITNIGHLVHGLQFPRFGETALEIQRWYVGPDVAARLVSDNGGYNVLHRTVLHIDRNVWLRRQFLEVNRMEIAWKRSLRDFTAQVEDGLEVKACANKDPFAQGTTLKLYLRYDAERTSWSRSCWLNRERVVFRVNDRRPRQPTTEGWYYCEVHDEVEKVRKPGFRLVIVSLLLPIPERHCPD